ASAEAALLRYWSERDTLPPAELRAALAVSMVRRGEHWFLLHDPRLVRNFARIRRRDHDQIEEWAALACPTMVIHGERSLMLPPPVARRMSGLRPDTRVLTVPECGHRPWLRTPDQIAAVVAWLEMEGP
ncbi:MAG: hypothetical protein IT561_28100, partial [Alphaproteobacteria bacterium]|nr:hypothetical protein [Alphaproteobacteria bacterium]